MQKRTQDTAKEFVFTIFNVVNDDSLSQSGCEDIEDGLMVIDSGACPQVVLENRLFRKDTPRLRGASNLAEDRENNLKRYDFHVVEVTKP